ncbi:MAG: Rrf2 family transcriptional regulator [Candidatus Marinimicrobia bacterium]|jgi:Rrf2 family transcriptional regulator, iron-sulfur cluster assembly transcription factor|nr:Rrf2 family transcriptional regulator [Candidatus Neomarinimicrobiota bacterium]MBT4361290.1 Rrf2 family transcriptional regulator [Candidatus Neomarinimicrobiota bacterium]MBT4715038.1 Rrf2 family transcriptional regulator [Candidatus Neomarinimicrobiota bacterium]MBT4944577.1 Rrf2 family transcriptional regulator [Candidatus Neomarinimicrobiota bacterium]MBT5271381.1 Rrf2 family transcriptional regulator [Candidatus Neomarinimicrobiota bacterium]
MILSRSTEYAIRLIFYLSDRQPLAQYVRIKDAAKDLDVSYYQLAKVANVLSTHKILKSSTGSRGGIDLSDHANSLPLSVVLEIFGDDGIFDRCILGLHECSNENPCPIHAVWGTTRGELKTTFFDKTLGDLKTDALIPFFKKVE